MCLCLYGLLEHNIPMAGTVRRKLYFCLKYVRKWLFDAVCFHRNAGMLETVYLILLMLYSWGCLFKSLWRTHRGLLFCGIRAYRNFFSYYAKDRVRCKNIHKKKHIPQLKMCWLCCFHRSFSPKHPESLTC